MTYYETQQQSPLQNPQFNPQLGTLFNPQIAHPYGQSFGMPMPGIGYGLGQAAYGQQFGQYGFGGQPSIGAPGQSTGWGAQPAWWGQQQRQLSQQDVSDVVRQLLPALPQILAQAQQPQAIGYAAYGQTARSLTPQDVNEVVRQLLPMVPQIVGTLQGQPQLQHVAMHGGVGWGQQWGQPAGLAPPIAPQIPFTGSYQPQLGQYGWPQFQSAFGASPLWGQPQRQLTQQDVADVTRQLVGLIPQVIGNLQAFSQQRMI
jgi:hypothetical protein